MIQPNYNGGAQVAMLPYEKQLIIERKIPLFELEKRSSSKLDSNDYGYVNVKATKHENSDRIPIELKWFSGRVGYVRYSRDQNGRYIGYLPDDPEWYNRTKLSATILNSNFRISKYINELGLITVSAEITEELNLIGSEIRDWVAKIESIIVIRSKNIKEVEEYVKKKRSEGIAIQGPMLELNERLGRIRDGGHKHDWIFSPEYQNEVIPEMKEKINKKFKRDVKQTPEIESAVSKVIPQFLSNMSIEQLNYLIKKKMEEEPKEDVIKNKQFKSNGVPLEELTINKIRTIAVKDFGIKTLGKSRAELIDLINEKIRETSDDVNDVVGPPTPEEIKNREAAGLPPLETVESI